MKAGALFETGGSTRRVNAEDTALIRRVQQGMGSSYYRPGPLGKSEVCLRSFAQKLRRIIPETRPGGAPRSGGIEGRATLLLGGR